MSIFSPPSNYSTAIYIVSNNDKIHLIVTQFENEHDIWH